MTNWAVPESVRIHLQIGRSLMMQPLRYFVLVLALVGWAAAATAQDKLKDKLDKKTGRSMQCSDSNNGDRLYGHCEIKEQSVPAGGVITVDGKQNGGISIKGWD